MWSQPSTDDQRRYYSKHAPKRRVYGVIQTILQCAHAGLAFAAWASIFAWALQKFAGAPYLVTLLSVGSLAALHSLFRVTWSTFWYDRLDDDPNTDSSFVIPIGILVLLLFIEVKGATMFLSGQVKEAAAIDASPIDASHQTAIASIDQAYQNEKAEIISVYKAKEQAAAAPYDRQIRSATARLNGADADQRKAINRQIASLRAQRDQATSPVLSARADALQKALDVSTQRKAGESGRRDQAVASIDQRNQQELMRYHAEMSSVGSYAWMLSATLLFLIAALGYARVRINVKSGILPLRNYTVLDAHGSTIERLGTAFGDAFNRRSQQFAVWLHREMSPKNAITSFDGTVVAKPGTYNTPAGFHPPTPTPEAAPLPDEAATFEKVIRKMLTTGVKLTPAEFIAELEKARTMNGSYAAAPMPGK